MWQSWRPWNRWEAADSGGMPGLEHAFAFEITEDAFGQYSLNRNAKEWGYTVYPDLKIEKCDRM